jgi:hypothetical protein
MKSAKATSKVLDGPDCIEGGVFVLKTKEVNTTAGITIIKRKPNPNRL